MIVSKKLFVKVGLIVVLFLCALMIFSPNIYNIPILRHPAFSDLDRREFGLKVHVSTVEAFYRNRESWPHSKLGGILFSNEPTPHPNLNENRTYLILIWKHWQWLMNRHVFNFGKASNDNILSYCSVKNCQFTGEDKLIDTADAVVVHLQKGVIPTVENRIAHQRWIFLSDESPINTFSVSKSIRSFEVLKDIFNWSMTYRSDTDVPVPYGRTVALEEPIMESFSVSDIPSLIPFWETKQKDVSATILMSNCQSKARNAILKELRKHMKVDVYGACSDVPENRNRCPGHFKEDCEPISSYLFYLALENSNCFQYLTEKVFFHAYSKGAVPVIFGPSKEDCETLLPPNSYIYIEKKKDAEQVAKDILMLTEDLDLYLSLHLWRNNFKVVNEHGFFGTKSHHLCRLCEALNFNDESKKIYRKEDLAWYLNPSLTCKKVN